MNAELNNEDRYHEDDERAWNELPAELRAALQAMEERRAAQVGQPFDPSELLRLATEQWPHRPLVAASFALCTREWPESEWYTHFLGYTEGRSLRYAGGEFLEHPALGELIVDLVYDERVEGGVRVLGIEYLARVLARGGEDQSGEGLQHTGFVIGEYEEEPEEPDEEPCPHLRIVHVASTQRPTR